MSEHEGAAAVRVIESLEELVQLLDLGAVRFYELNAVWDDSGDPPPAEEVSEPEGADTDVDGVEEQHYEFRTAHRKRADGIDYRIEVEVPIQGGRLRADAAAMYVASEPFEVSPRLLFEYGNMVAAMTVIPYLRQAIMDLSIRVGTEVVVMPIIGRGSVVFGDEPTDSES